MSDQESGAAVYIWITRWEDFQHYTPDRDRAPAWIKTYTKQLDDDEYRNLTADQRGLLHDLRMAFSRSHGKLTTDTRRLCHRLGYRVLTRQLDSLNRAGFIEFVSRETLELNLESFYASRAGDRAHHLEVEEEGEEEEESSGSAVSPNPKSSPNEARPQANGTYADELERIAADQALQTGGGLNGRKIEEPYFARLLQVVGDTEENFVKLRRASRAQPIAATVQALEAATDPGARDPLAVALTVLSEYGKAPA